MLLLDIRNKMDITPGLSRKEFITRCYAMEIFENFIDNKHLIIFDDIEKLGIVTENDLLIGNWDWEMYSNTENSLFWTDDITMRLFGQKHLTPQEISTLTNDRNLLSIQADALKDSAQYVLTILKEMKYESTKEMA